MLGKKIVLHRIHTLLEIGVVLDSVRRVDI